MGTNGRTYYNCTECPAYCCAIYERVQVNKRDVTRLARYFGVTEEVAKYRYTKVVNKERILRRKADPMMGKCCMFLDTTTRQCTIYHGRPGTCRQFPDTPRCAYWDLLKFEKQQQGDPDALPLVQITFKNEIKNRNRTAV
jgi:Fe-S-cluster containining protein